MARKAAKPYQPSNGTEGESFQCDFCYRCTKDSEKRPCKILMATMIHRIDDKEYPKEWIYDTKGDPTCTAFSLRTKRAPRGWRPRRHKPAKNQRQFL